MKKKKWFRRIVALVCVMVQICCCTFTTTAVAEPEYDVAIFVGGEGASDSNDGSSTTASVATMNRAYELISQSEVATNAEKNAVIVVVGEVLASENGQNFNLPADGKATYSHAGTITVTSVYDGTDYRTSGAVLKGVELGANGKEYPYIQLGGPTVWENLKFVGTSKKTVVYAGDQFTIGEGFETELPNHTESFVVCPGWCRVTENTTANITINSGTIGTILATPWGWSHGVVTGTVNINLGGTAVVNQMYGEWGRAKAYTIENINVTVGGNAKLTTQHLGGGGTIQITNSTLTLSENGQIGARYTDGIQVTNQYLVLSNVQKNNVTLPDSTWNRLTVTGNSEITLAEKLDASVALVVDAGSTVTLAEDDNHAYSGEGTVIYPNEPPATEYDKVIFVGGEGASDSNDGSTVETSVATMNKAYELVGSSAVGSDATKNALIVIVGEVLISENGQNFNLPTSGKATYSHLGTVTVTSVYNRTDYRTSGAVLKGVELGADSKEYPYVQLGGPTVWENLKFEGTNQKTIVTAGEQFTIGEGFETVLPHNTQSLAICPGWIRVTEAATANITINSGTIGTILATPWGWSHGIVTDTVNINLGGTTVVNQMYGEWGRAKAYTIENINVSIGGNARLKSQHLGGGGTIQITNSTLTLSENGQIDARSTDGIQVTNQYLVLSNIQNDNVTLPDSTWNRLTVTGNSEITLAEKLDTTVALVVDAGSTLTLAKDDLHEYTGDGTVIYNHVHIWEQDPNHTSTEGDCYTQGNQYMICFCGETQEMQGYNHSFIDGVCSVCQGRADVVFVSDGGTGDGYNNRTAVGTLEDAYKLLLERTSIATDAAATAQIVVCGATTVAQSFNTDGAIQHEGTVIYTSEGYAEASLSFAAGSGQSILLPGPTKMENLTIGGAVTIYVPESLEMTENVKMADTADTAISIRGGSCAEASDKDVSIILNGGTYDFVAPSNEQYETTGNYDIQVGGNAVINSLVSGETAITISTPNRPSASVTVSGNCIIKELYLAGDTANTLSVVVQIRGGKIEKILEGREGKIGTVQKVQLDVSHIAYKPSSIQTSNQNVVTGNVYTFVGCDMDGDYQTDITECRMLRAAFVGDGAISVDFDCNGDGVVDSRDLVHMKKLAATVLVDYDPLGTILENIPGYNHGGTYVQTYATGAEGHYEGTEFASGVDIDDPMGGGQMLVYQDITSAGPYNAYQATLQESGYRLYANNKLDNNFFATYVNDDTEVTLSYLDNEDQLNILVEPLRTLPGLPEENVYTNRNVENKIAMLTCGQVNGRYNGMCIIYQLCDGSFMIWDSGFGYMYEPGGQLNPNGAYDKTWQNQAKEIYATLEMMTEESGTEDITIAAWFFTHPHNDHIGGIVPFADLYADKVTVEKIIYNWPNHETLQDYINRGKDKSTHVIAKLDETFAKFEGAKLYDCHPGQTFYIRDAKIDILMNWELQTEQSSEYVSCDEGNSSSVVGAVEIAGLRIMMTGDCAVTETDMMNRLYSAEFLKSDGNQVAHHGLNYWYANTFNDKIDADFVLYTSDDWSYYSENFINNPPTYAYNMNRVNTMISLPDYSKSETWKCQYHSFDFNG